MKTEITEIHDGFEITNSDWTCGLTDGEGVRNVGLSIFANILDMREFDSEYDNAEFPFMLDFKIVPTLDSLSEESIDSLVADTCLEPNVSDISSCLGSVNIDINSCSHVNEDFTNINCDKIKDSAVYCATQEDAEAFVQKIAMDRLESIMLTIGFALDLPVNRIGTTGWEVLESIIYGEDFVKKTLARRCKEMEVQ
jgi:hypothetical protein